MRAPFDYHGSLQHYPEQWFEYPDDGEPRIPHGSDWREVEPWTETLIFDGYRRGRSAAYFLWRTKEAEYRTYPMFMTDMADLIEFDVIEHGVVRGTTWRIVKRGQNYGIARVGE